MEKTVSWFVLGLILAFSMVCGLIALPNSATAGEPIIWKMQTAWPETSDMILHFQKPFADLVKGRSNGRLEIKWMPLNAILGAEDIFGGCSKGVVQGGCSVGAYHSRVVPEAFVGFGLPFNFATYDHAYDFWYRYKNMAFLKMLDQAYREKGVHLLAGVAYGETFHTNFPVTSVDDIKKRKIRAVGSAGHFTKALGGSPVSLPMGETYMALQRGTVDGTLGPVQGVRTFRLMEVVKYTSLPPVRLGFVEIYCSLDAYNKLPSDLQKIVDEAAIEAGEKYFRPYYEEREKLDIEDAKRAGVTITRVSKAEYNKMANLVKPIWDEAAAKSPRCAQMVELIKTYLEEKQ